MKVTRFILVTTSIVVTAPILVTILGYILRDECSWLVQFMRIGTLTRIGVVTR
jgi:hypothetical protein